MAKRKPTIRHAEIVGLFGARLREVRLTRGMTQVELAERAEVSVNYIGRLEAGGAAPGIDLVDRLAKALATTVSDLLPAAPPPDTFDLLRQQATGLFDSVMRTADRDTLLMLNPLLARIADSLVRGP